MTNVISAYTLTIQYFFSQSNCVYTVLYKLPDKNIWMRIVYFVAQHIKNLLLIQ